MRQKTKTRSPSSVTTAPDSVPLIDSRYRIESFLGSGAYAWVFLARHTTLQNREFAVKVLRPEHVSDDAKKRRFLREAELASALTSPFTVDVVDYGETETGAPYIVMDYVRGPDLGAVLNHYGVLDESIVARLTLNILSALDEAHGYGIVHRDLKPENIFVVQVPGDDHPVAKVGDFGIAKVISETSPVPSRATQTALGTVLCTPAYASPELLKGEVTVQADIYALGHVMAEMLDGDPPYSDSHPVQVGAKQLEESPVPLGARASASVLRPIIARALEKRQANRYLTSREMREDLEALIARESLIGPDDAPLDIAAVRPSRERSPLAEAGVGLSQITRTDSLVVGDEEDRRSTDELKTPKRKVTERLFGEGFAPSRETPWFLPWIILALAVVASLGFLWMARRASTEQPAAEQAVAALPEPVELPSVSVTWNPALVRSGTQHGLLTPDTGRTVKTARQAIKAAHIRAEDSLWSTIPLVPWLQFVRQDSGSRNSVE